MNPLEIVKHARIETVPEVPKKIRWKARIFGKNQIEQFYERYYQRESERRIPFYLPYLNMRTHFDYVIFAPYEKDYDGDMTEYLQPMMDIFLAVNPDVQFFFAVPEMAYSHEFAWIAKLPEIDRNKITVCNWGKMLTDILNGTVQVPGATQPYFKNSFIVSASEKDGYHQNVLVGYLTALMIYCAITGDSAVGMPYDFCNDSSIDTRFNFKTYKADKYVYDTFTNFIEIFESNSDMAGLQQLVDQYIAAPFGS